MFSLTQYRFLNCERTSGCTEGPPNLGSITRQVPQCRCLFLYVAGALLKETQQNFAAGSLYRMLG